MSGHFGINGWTCEKCGETTYCVDIHEGVTPMMLACRATTACNGTARSLFYPRDPPEHVLAAVRWEWYRPSDKQARRMGARLAEHVERGGLVIRPLTALGRESLGLDV